MCIRDRCRGDPTGETDGDSKKIRIYKLCSDTDCLDGSWDMIYDEIYMGRVEINANGGNKRRTLYFQADYIFNE